MPKIIINDAIPLDKGFGSKIRCVKHRIWCFYGSALPPFRSGPDAHFERRRAHVGRGSAGHFRRIRWADNGGEPYCPRCGCLKVAASTRPVWKCSGCKYQFSVTAGTIFADRKRPVRDYLLAIAIFANSAKGHAHFNSVAISIANTRRLSSWRTNCAKRSQRTSDVSVSGTVEVDGAYFARHEAEEQSGGTR